MSVDEFNQFKTTLLSLEHQHIIEQLELRNFTLRMDSIAENIQTILDIKRADSTFHSLTSQWEKLWDKCYLSLLTDMEQPVREIAQRFALQDIDPKKSHTAIDHTRSIPPQKNIAQENSQIWNPQAQTHLANTFKQLIVEAELIQVPSKPFKAALESTLNLAPEIINFQAEDSMLSSLVTLSSLAKRSLFKLVGTSELLLPLTTLNTEKAALKGLYKGIEKGLNSLKNEIDKSIEETFISQTEYFAKGTLLLNLCKTHTPEKKVFSDKLLSRTLTQ